MNGANSCSCLGASQLSLHEPYESKPTRPSKAAEHRRTPRRWRVGYGAPNIRQVLECAAAAAPWIPTRFMVSMHGTKLVEALHEPTHPQPLPRGEQAFVRVLSVPLLGGVRGRFMVPMHGRKAEEALQERGRIPRGIWTKPSGLCAGQTQGLPETPSTCSLSPRLRRFRLLRRAPIRTVPGIVEFCETPGCVFGVSGWS